MNKGIRHWLQKKLNKLWFGYEGYPYEWSQQMQAELRQERELSRKLRGDLGSLYGAINKLERKLSRSVAWNRKQMVALQKMKEQSARDHEYAQHCKGFIRWVLARAISPGGTLTDHPLKSSCEQALAGEWDEVPQIEEENSSEVA